MREIFLCRVPLFDIHLIRFKILSSIDADLGMKFVLRWLSLKADKITYLQMLLPLHSIEILFYKTHRNFLGYISSN